MREGLTHLAMYDGASLTVTVEDVKKAQTYFQGTTVSPGLSKILCTPFGQGLTKGASPSCSCRRNSSVAHPPLFKQISKVTCQ